MRILFCMNPYKPFNFSHKISFAQKMLISDPRQQIPTFAPPPRAFLISKVLSILVCVHTVRLRLQVFFATNGFMGFNVSAYIMRL